MGAEASFQLQTPRLTTALRALNKENEQFFDIDKAYVERRAFLEALRQRRTASAAVGTTWLAKKLVGVWDAAPVQIRRAYEEFLNVVGDLLGGEVASEELQESAGIVYDCLHDMQMSARAINDKRLELKELFGFVIGEHIQKVAELARVLSQWSLRRSVPPTANEMVGEDRDEFGFNLCFQPPTRLEQQRQNGQQRQDDQPDHVAVASGAEEEKIDLRWLYNICKGSGDELALAVCRVLESPDSGDQVATSLFDLLGDNGFEHIQILLQHRKSLVEAFHKGFSNVSKASQPSQSRMPSYGTQVSVQSSLDRQIDKLRRKEEKKHGKRANLDDSEFETVGGFAAVVEASERIDEGVAGLVGKGDSYIGVTGASLPPGTVRKAYKGYEEVHVPPTPTSSLKPGEALVRIEDLDDIAQAGFEGYKTLNRIQSKIFSTAYYSNENILVCAPTGAGKTNIAMITVLHEIRRHFISGILQKSEFKIVYIAPMKALAAEVTGAFSRRLAPLNVVVKELTGDMQLTKRELEETQMIVTTPEKWDVITRKTSDMSLAALVKLLIIDEVHLLNDERGSVIEALVARTLRQVESSQSMIRIVGLSATLPNYQEVAKFLRVSSETGLFYFDASYRPVPLMQKYVGVSESNFVLRNTIMNEVCYGKVLEAVRQGHQAMVFVHSRKDTVKTARILVEMAQKNGDLASFINTDHPQYGVLKKEASSSRSRELWELFQSGFGVHHAGMLRSQRNLTERLFSEGLLTVLVCTATLAWGVNLPAHTVIIKGTQLYDPKAGGWRELGILDVMQIFGRAGRPQFDTSGEGVIITTHDKLVHYLRLMTHQLPIESQFVSSLKDNLNAEIVLGTVTNVREATTWLGYTYLYVRMQSNPLAYGLTWDEAMSDPALVSKRNALIIEAARALNKAKMIRFDEKSETFYVTDLGRVASHFYLQYTSVETYNEMLKQHMSESELLKLVSHSSEFENIVVREEEQPEILKLLHTCCPLEVYGGTENKFGKINILIQVYISQGYLDGFSLIVDSAYISASLGRIMRALFEICLRRGWCSMAAMTLEYCKAVDHRIWPQQHPLRQFQGFLSAEVLRKLEDRGADLDKLYDMSEKEIGSLINNPYGGKLVRQCVEYFPFLNLFAHVSPITRTVLQVKLTITADFVWKERFHGSALRWWIWVEDSDNEHIYHSEHWTLTKKMASEGAQTISFAIPIFEPIPTQYYIRTISDTWLQASSVHTLSFQHLILPELHPPHTELLNLQPLPVSALKNKAYEGRYKFSHFNPIQTQAFHTLYHTDHNVLLGAPTGSGKTISSELAMLRLFNTQPDMKVIYIAPLKALVRERVDDWKTSFAPVLGKKLVELTGDFTPDLLALLEADIIISTPEKWDGISRSWHNRSYVMKVGLIIIDEIHLLGGDRGPILEVIVSRMRYISSQTERSVRFVGLSTALANARDLADWLGIDNVGLYNFKPTVRPVQLEVHIQGFPGKFYCPRMNSMNKPTYAAIRTHSPTKPVLIFVSSRRQTRLTALDIIQFAAADEQPRQFLAMSEEDMSMLLYKVLDSNLKHTLQFGIGLHHAGLCDSDRSLVEELFYNNKIQVLVCTSTLAWGINLPAHLVVVKGTEYYDAKRKRYEDYPITDVLQMMGRAGRPQFDQHGKAVILVHEPKKSFYKKFLYEPFPVESSLVDQLHDHLNAEIAAGTVKNKQDALYYLTWTFLYRRLVMNPSYYGLEDTSSESINYFLSSLVNNTIEDLENAGCIQIVDDNMEPQMPGLIASKYYMHYKTLALFSSSIHAECSLEGLVTLLCAASEYDELPVRHNEENLNAVLAEQVRFPVNRQGLDDPHVKTNLLMQAHFSRLELPITDYVTDTKSVLDQSIRILQAMVDIAANGGWLRTTIMIIQLLQMVMQGMWSDDSPFAMLPNLSLEDINRLPFDSLDGFLSCSKTQLQNLVSSLRINESCITQAWSRLPRVELDWKVRDLRSEPDDKERISFAVDIRSKCTRRKSNTRAFLPRYSKSKEEGWWLVLGDTDTWELYAMKRVSIKDEKSRTSLAVTGIPAGAQELKLFLVSDSYVGLDQTHSLHFDQ